MKSLRAKRFLKQAKCFKHTHTQKKKKKKLLREKPFEIN